MIAHVVLFKPKPDLSPDARAALISAFQRAAAEIPGVRAIRIGRRTLHGAGYEAVAPDTADYLITLDFADLAGLRAYLRHPAHEDLGVRFGEAFSSALVYDFEVGGLEDLAKLV